MPEANPAEARGNAHAPKAIRIYKLIVIVIFAGFFEIYIRRRLELRVLEYFCRSDLDEISVCYRELPT